MTELVAMIVMWLAANFDLPASEVYPELRFLPSARMAELRYAGIEPARRRDVVAVYDDTTRTIYLPSTWTGRAPAELSVLVHEMVHHLQSVAGLSYACAGEREALAYEAQERWLGLFGHSLASEFGLDPVTLKLSTACMPP